MYFIYRTRFPVIPASTKQFKEVNPVLILTNKSNFLKNLNKLNIETNQSQSSQLNTNTKNNTSTNQFFTKTKFGRSSSMSFFPLHKQNPELETSNPQEEFNNVIKQKRVYYKVKDKSPSHSQINISNISAFGGDSKEKALYCPYCEHCNQINDKNLIDHVTIIKEAKNIINKCAQHILDSQYLLDKKIENNKWRFDYFEKTLNVNIILIVY